MSLWKSASSVVSGVMPVFVAGINYRMIVLEPANDQRDTFEATVRP